MFTDKEIKTVLKRNLPEIVDEVEINGHILDQMEAFDIISSEETRTNIESKQTRQDRTRALYRLIQNSSHCDAGRIFLKALYKEYNPLAKKILEQLE